MHAEQLQDWHRLSAKAREALLRGEWWTRLAILPAFDSWHVFGAFHSSRKQVARAEWRTWESAADARAVESPVARLAHPREFQPTVSVRERSIPNSSVNVLLQRLNTIALPVLPASSLVGADGIRYELTVSSGPCSSQLSWWCDHPREWRPLMDWFLDAARFFADAFEMPTDQRPDLIRPDHEGRTR